jgi:hypothetical protein
LVPRQYRGQPDRSGIFFVESFAADSTNWAARRARALGRNRRALRAWRIGNDDNILYAATRAGAKHRQRGYPV